MAMVLSPILALAIAGCGTGTGDTTDPPPTRIMIKNPDTGLFMRYRLAGAYDSNIALLLTTGGPAVQIVGELDENQEPKNARLMVQDWFTPWTEYVEADHDVLLDYCRVFYFGE